MNDYERLKQLLTDFGVGFTETIATNGTLLVYCAEGRAKVGGYPLSSTVFAFDAKGTFIDMGAWE
jgi:hypothetical protein